MDFAEQDTVVMAELSERIYWPNLRRDAGEVFRDVGQRGVHGFRLTLNRRLSQYRVSSTFELEFT